MATTGYLVLAYAVYAGELGGILAVAALLLGGAVVLGLFVGMVILHHIETILGDSVFSLEDE